jgi:hypothetical protein
MKQPYHLLTQVRAILCICVDTVIANCVFGGGGVARGVEACVSCSCIGRQLVTYISRLPFTHGMG